MSAERALAGSERIRALRERAWTDGSGLGLALAPLAVGYRAGVAARRLAYRVGLFRTERVTVPVVSIGNLTVGGTGKTPAALWLVKHLQEQGMSPAVVTRGYSGALGGRIARAVPVGAPVGADQGGIAEVGDEAVLLAERFSGPVVCGVDRVAAARFAIERCGANVVVLDDGFQHWRLARDLDVVLVNGHSGFGNGALLPAGPLREPLSALARAGVIVLTKAAAPAAEVRRLIERRVPEIPLLEAELTARCLVGVVEGVPVERPLGDLVGRRVVTVCGVGQPQSFYDLLGQLEVRPVEVLEYPDHHDYAQSDWQRITQAAHGAELVVCTEKDLVKLRRYPFARDLLVALRVDFTFAAEDQATFLRLVLERVGWSDKLREQGARAT